VLGLHDGPFAQHPRAEPPLTQAAFDDRLCEPGHPRAAIYQALYSNFASVTPATPGRSICAVIV